MTRRIRNVAVLGSGVMGSAIAAHFANVGLSVLLLDIVPKDLLPEEQAKGLSLNDKAVRNRIVDDSLRRSIASKPSPIYHRDFASRIRTGNFDDDLHLIKDADWVIEVVVERLDIKKLVFEKVEKFRKPGSIISSNTSGIPIYTMLEGRSEDFVANFCGTHFFNPPRYLKLFEIIPTQKTDPDLVNFLTDYAARFLGKTPVLCKDTPAFIANRVGVFSIMALFHLVDEMALTVDEVDKLSGPVLGRPKSATFRTCDVVGLDTLVHVANGLDANCPNDERHDLFTLPNFVAQMQANNWLGDKSKQGFYKKTKNAEGKREILSLDLKTLEYKPKAKVKFETLEQTKSIGNLGKRTKVLYEGTDRAGEFYRKSFNALFAYVSYRIPEIADDLFKIDDGMKAGFGWQLGPFEAWDAVGVEAAIAQITSENNTVAQWVVEMLGAGAKSFYLVEDGVRKYWHIGQKQYVVMPGSENRIELANLKATATLWENADASIIDLGDGILNVEFHSKMNTIGAGTLQALNKAIDMAEKDYKGVVVANEGEHFSAGANVGMIYMLALEQEWDELSFAVSYFQKTMMRMRYSSVPVVAAPHGMTLGGGCELCMHTDKVVAHAELYMGLVEFGVGLIPGGGGSKEFAVRLSDELKEGDVRVNRFTNRFLTIGQAQVSTSAYEAFDKGYLRAGTDEVVVDRASQLRYAKDVCLALANKGYTQPVPRTDIKILGNEALGLVYAGADAMMVGDYMSEHDKLIAEKLGFVLAGGDISAAMTEVSEQYLLDLERKAFVLLCTSRKTLERMQSLVKSGKILRN
jgi:3-hydroxyacyl-CoA dehydrogenase